MTLPLGGRLVQVLCDGPKPFTAAFISDGTVRKCAPILRNTLLGATDEQARAIIAAMGWHASVVRARR